MKFDRRSPRSWAIFLLAAASTALAVGVAAMARLVRWPRPRRRRLVLFSHLPSGNVHALAQRAPESFFRSWDVRFLHVEPGRDGAAGPRVGDLLALNPLDMLWVARSDVVVCTHGPGLLRPLMGACPDLHFVDVWHGIGFVDRRRYLHEVRGFSLLLQPSEWTARYLIDLGADPATVAVTGHGAWDALLDADRAAACASELGLQDDDRPRVLIAPTWTHGRLWEQRDAFGAGWDDIAVTLDSWAARRGVLILFRSHLNAGAGLDRVLGHVRNVPFRHFPDTAAVLAIADVLVTDWSSIANDYLPTGRPIVYLDVPPPFVVGHLGADDRPGELVGSVEDLVRALDEAVGEPAAYRNRFAARRRSVEEKVCGSMADGRAVERYVAALERLVPPR